MRASGTGCEVKLRIEVRVMMLSSTAFRADSPGLVQDAAAMAKRVKAKNIRFMKRRNKRFVIHEFIR